MAQSLQEKREERRRRRQEEPAEEPETKGITESKGRATPSRRKGETENSDTTHPILRPFKGMRDYLVGVQTEMQKVTWPNREETSRLTRIVMVVLVASSLFLGGLSILFTEIFNLGVNQPWIFILVFVGFLVALFAYARFSSQADTPDF
jgi:preprotein translocase SecE subunit